MEIKELYMKNFGKFSDCHFYIKDQLHIFYGENEFGKSTIYAFIKAMLFGLERARGRAAQQDSFSRYEPWENPNFYEGLIRFESGGKIFCLERKFDRYGKSASLICETDGEKLSVEDGDLAILLGEMTEQAFENIFAVGQLLPHPGATLATELQDYAANYYQTASDTVMISKALSILQEQEKEIEKEKKKLFNNQSQQKNELEQENSYVRRDKDKLEMEYAETLQKIETCRLRKSECHPVNEKTEENGQRKHHTILTTILLLLAGLVSLLLMQTGLVAKLVSDFILILLTLLFWCGGVFCFWKTVAKSRKPVVSVQTNSSTDEDARKDRSISADDSANTTSDRMIAELEWKVTRIQEELQEKNVILQNLQERMEELEDISKEIQPLLHKQKALELAQQRILELSRQMAQNFGDVLNQKASQILEEMTNGRYTRLFIDEHLGMEILENGKRISVKRLSAGTIEQIYFALRMAVAELLYTEPMPFIFDEAFALYDEKRLKATLKWLSRQQRQVIIFTCQRREQEILNAL